MRNPEEAALVSTPDGRARYATAIADGIMAWLTSR
jgi:N-acetylmuramoyl-L-alanine amidase